MNVNNRQIIAVYIRGLAFKCASGSRREQVLVALKKQDERKGDSIWLVIAVGLFTAGLFYLGFQYGLWWIS